MQYIYIVYRFIFVSIILLCTLYFTIIAFYIVYDDDDVCCLLLLLRQLNDRSLAIALGMTATLRCPLPCDFLADWVWPLSSLPVS